MTLKFIRKNYQALRNKALKNGEKFSIFSFKTRKTPREILERNSLNKELRENKFYKKKKLWTSRLRRMLRERRSSIYSRCNYPSCHKFEYYGGKGIKMFLTINDMEFLFHRDNAVSMKQPSIDRIDPNCHYEYSNCRFIEMSENRARRFHG